MLRVVTGFTSCAVLVFLLVASAASAAEERLHIQPGDMLPPNVMDQIPGQFRDQLILLEFSEPLAMRSRYEGQGNNVNPFDIPRTGIQTYFFVNTDHYAERDVQWVKDNLPYPLYVTPIYTPAVQMNYFPQRILAFNGRVSMLGHFDWPDVTSVWNGWGGGVRIEEIRPVTEVVTKRGGYGATLAKPASYEVDLHFAWFPHFATSDGYGSPPADLQIKIRPHYMYEMANGSFGNSVVTPVLWNAKTDARHTVRLDFPEGAAGLAVGIEMDQNAKWTSRLENIQLPRPPKT